MDGKTIGFIAAIAIAIFFAAGVSQYLAIDSEKKSLGATLTEAKTLLESTKTALEKKRAMVDDMRQKLAAAQAVVDLDKEKTTINAEITALEGARTAVQQEFVDRAVQVRSLSSGMTVPDFALPNGQVLTAVKIQKVTDTDVTFSHNQGVAKVSANDVPAELKARFRYGMLPFTK